MRKAYAPKVIRSAPALILVGALICCAPAYARQSGQRVVGPAPEALGRRSPVEVVSVSYKGAAVAPGLHFEADDDWLRGLTFRVKNVSDKPLMYLYLSLRLRAAADKSKYADFRGLLGYGCWPGHPCPPDADGTYKKIMPGEEGEVELVAAKYKSCMAQLAKSAMLPVESAEYYVDTVFFDADTMWAANGFLYKRDAAKPDEFKRVGKYELPKRP